MHASTDYLKKMLKLEDKQSKKNCYNPEKKTDRALDGLNKNL